MPAQKPELFRLNVKAPNILSLVFLVAFASMGAILMTPGLPDMARYFDVNSGTAQLVVTGFLVGYAVGQLIYGPIANRLGRKPAFYIGIAIATAGSLFSIVSGPVNSFGLLVFGRVLEALGSSVGLVICFTIINDFYYPEEARKTVALMVLAFSLVPGFAVAIGGILVQYFGWKACFYALLIYGLCLIYAAMRLPETVIKRDPKALHHRYLIKNYISVLREPGFIGFSIVYGLSSACVYVFSAEGPFIGIHFLNLAPGSYGLLALLPNIGMLLGSFITIKMQGAAPQKMLKIGFCFEAGAAIVMFLGFAFSWITMLTLLLPMGFLMLGHGIFVSNASSLAMAKTEDKANGSAMMNFLCVSMSALATLILGVLHVKSPLILPVMFLCILSLMVFVYSRAQRSLVAREAPSQV